MGLKLKCGDTVVVRGAGKGRVVGVSPGSGKIRVRFSGVSGVRSFPMSEITNIKKKKSNDRSWTFKVGDCGAIDWELIIEDLSKDKPLQLITLNGNDYFVAIHTSLLYKASNSDVAELPDPVNMVPFRQDLDKVGVYRVPDPNWFALTTMWARDVRAAKWVGNVPCTVKVSMPNV